MIFAEEQRFQPPPAFQPLPHTPLLPEVACTHGSFPHLLEFYIWKVKTDLFAGIIIFVRNMRFLMSPQFCRVTETTHFSPYPLWLTLIPRCTLSRRHCGQCILFYHTATSVACIELLFTHQQVNVEFQFRPSCIAVPWVGFFLINTYNISVFVHLVLQGYWNHLADFHWKIKWQVFITVIHKFRFGSSFQ